MTPDDIKLDQLLGQLLEKFILPKLPVIEGCDPWELTSRDHRGRTRYTLTIACSERRRNGYSNHAFAEIWWTGSAFKCAWTHGQGHYYDETAGNTRSFKPTKGVKVALTQVFAHVRQYAQHDAEIYVIC